MKKLIFGFPLVAVLVSIALIFRPITPNISEIHAPPAPIPVSGTFIVPDITYKSEAEYRQFFTELQDSGIDTVIFTLTTHLNKNCSTNTYTEEIDIRLNAGSPPFLPIAIRLAKNMNFKIFFDLGHSIYHTVPLECFRFDRGFVGDEATDKGRLIAFSLRSLNKLKNFVTSLGISWDDPQIVGFYLSPEGDTRLLANPNNSSQLLFFQDFARLIKEQEPNKKIMISPYQYQDADYQISYNSFLNLLNLTQIDIIAPQDSIGTGVTATLTRSADHFRALRDAHNQHLTDNPGSKKQIWANIESFGRPGYDNFVNYPPAEFSRLKSQIDTVSPYVSKMITWIYQHSMLSNPLSDNIAAINPYAPYYTPENAVLRKELRNRYLTYYRNDVLYYFHTPSQSCKATSNTYTDFYLCADNLNIYLPQATTGQCFLSNEACKQANELSDLPAQAGDLNGDGRVDIFDFNLLVSGFGNPYTIFDYNNLVGNFGK